MLQLLAWAKQRCPDIQAVSSGAIASDYQRMRVEHVRAHSQGAHCGPWCLSSGHAQAACPVLACHALAPPC